MARTVTRDRAGRFVARVWDPGGVDAAGLCPADAMAHQVFPTAEEASQWVRDNERKVIERYRARCAWESGTTSFRREWAPWFRIWNADLAVEESEAETTEERIQIWLGVYEHAR